MSFYEYIAPAMGFANFEVLKSQVALARGFRVERARVLRSFGSERLLRFRGAGRRRPESGFLLRKLQFKLP